MMTTSTDLGRRVMIDDWYGWHRDRLLATLYAMRDTGGDGNGLKIDSIGSVTGLESERVRSLVFGMRSKPKLIELRYDNGKQTGEPDIVCITARGVRWVEESPNQPRTA
jgi:hypothetical protein